jgi:AcrR family transcriptional regulator
MSPTDTRERILDGFTDQLLEVGYLGISLDRITTAIGIRRPSLYHHFPGGKEQLYTEVALRIIDRTGQRVAAAVRTPGDLRAKLEALALIHVDDPRAAALDQRIYDATRHVADEVRAQVSTRYVEDVLAPAQQLMADAVADGQLRDVDPGLLMNVFFEMAQAVPSIPDDVGMPAELRGDPGPGVDARVREVVDLFLHGAASDR